MNLNLNRRAFLAWSATAIAGNIISAHEYLEKSPSQKVQKKNNIAELKLDCAVPINEMVDFYHHNMHFGLLEATEEFCSFECGHSILTFTYTPNSINPPFYHFAFNISHNKIQHAEEWLAQRTQLLEAPKHLRERKIESRSIVHFKHLNAHSLFFYDPAGNIVEFIARHTMASSGIGKFTKRDILNISEIGFVVDDPSKYRSVLHDTLGLNSFGRSKPNFLAMGDEHALLLFFKENSKEVFGKGRNRDVYYTHVKWDSAYEFEDCVLFDYPYFICKA